MLIAIVLAVSLHGFDEFHRKTFRKTKLNGTQTHPKNEQKKNSSETEQRSTHRPTSFPCLTKGGKILFASKIKAFLVEFNFPE